MKFESYEEYFQTQTVIVAAAGMMYLASVLFVPEIKVAVFYIGMFVNASVAWLYWCDFILMEIQTRFKIDLGLKDENAEDATKDDDVGAPPNNDP
ncbi:MAG: hypothetical protein AAGF71_13500 [Pseudomonadota bacterium]